MEHQISFLDVQTGWHNALPLGNGKMGAMVYYKDRCLHIALNHYDCYYHVLSQYARQPEDGENAAFDDPARRVKTYRELSEAAGKARQEKDYGRSHYLRTLNPGQGNKRPVYRGGSYPQGGELTLAFSEKVDISHTSLVLHIERAVVKFSAGVGDTRIEAEICAASGYDGILLNLRQTAEGLWERAGILRQEARGQGKYRYEDRQEKEMISMLCRFRPDGESEKTEAFVQETAFYLPGTQADGSLEKCGKEFCLTGSIRAGEGSAKREARVLWEDREHEKVAHRKSWRRFWRSSVTLPDKYLETLWHLYVYVLGCCSGQGSVHSEQACGLSGLWDIRRPCMWGSMWYWDVNIQTAFYGAFASNHMELVKVFCDGFLSYEEEVKKFAECVYGHRGWALDYPHPLYNCIQPWCALFLWKYYDYTKNEGFLREKAYPVFLEMAEFYRWLTGKEGDAALENDTGIRNDTDVRSDKRDGRNGIRHMEYDITPEQGPVTKDSVITTASVKQMLRYASQAAQILKRPAEEQEMLAKLLDTMPEYAVTVDGKRWKDSGMVQDNIFLRHPSVLMPVFPADEVHMGSPERLKELAEETIRYAAENTEMGTFGFVWIAAAAARMGAGESALRILYEKGLDYMTHSNGIGYEESERFINYCHLTKPANYLPVMCEMGGGVTAAVNLMMLQEIDGVLHVFPAVPDGKDRYAVPVTQYCHDDRLFAGNYGHWEECGFEGMLAPGGFVVSAQMSQGEADWIRVEAQKDGELKLWLPAGLLEEKKAGVCAEEMESGAYVEEVEAGEDRKEIGSIGSGVCTEEMKDGIYRKQMKTGETVVFKKREMGSEKGMDPEKETGLKEETGQGKRTDLEMGMDPEKRRDSGEEIISETYQRAPGVLMRRAARTRRRTFIGEDRDTAYYKAIDAMVCPYGFGETHRYAMTPYVFDFTDEPDKDYDEVYAPQLIEAGRAVLLAGGPRCAGTERYTADRGYGFLEIQVEESAAAGQNKACGNTADRNTAGQNTAEPATLVKRPGPDALRRDFVQGGRKTEFGIELPAGKYDILVISGDENESSLTHLAVPDAGVFARGLVQGRGRYQCRLLPVMHRQDGILRLAVDTDPGLRWKLNAVFVNKEYMLL